ncbi:hypothetical protein OF83DRAFT_1178092 [Amylostereum chailletii]|nr:hypothetical protein OF83DRAFT_1178092 [Amylostereum chailletii]
MALELLCTEFLEVKIRRLYRHDMEGYIWKLPWLCLQYDGEKWIPHPLCLEWVDEHLQAVHVAKVLFSMASIDKVVPLPIWEPHWLFVCKLVEVVKAMHLARQAVKLVPRPRPTLRKLYPDSSSRPTLNPALDHALLDFPPEVEYQLVWEVLRVVHGEEGYAINRRSLGLPLDMPGLPKALWDVLADVLKRDDS